MIKGKCGNNPKNNNTKRSHFYNFKPLAGGIKVANSANTALLTKGLAANAESQYTSFYCCHELKLRLDHKLKLLIQRCPAGFWDVRSKEDIESGVKMHFSEVLVFVLSALTLPYPTHGDGEIELFSWIHEFVFYFYPIPLHYILERPSISIIERD